MDLKHIFLRCFHSTCFYNSPGFHVSSFAVFQVWLLTYYIYFSNKADKLLESLFSLFYLSKEGPDVKDFGFMGNNICHDIKNIFIKNGNLLINTLVKKSSSSVELGYGLLD